jgi:predicted ATP-dependent protease
MYKYEVPAEKLTWRCDPEQFKFECTKDVAPLREFIGQERARRAMEFGLNMVNDGYNIYMSGISGTGKTSMVKSYIEKLIKEREAKGEQFILDDWCYIYNFKEPDRPQIIQLPQGHGKIFRDQITDLLNDVKDKLGKAFSSDEYKEQTKTQIEQSQSEEQQSLDEIAREARKQGFILRMTPMGPVIIPMVQDRPMEEKEYLNMDDSTRKKVEEKQAELTKKLHYVFDKVSNMQKQTAEQLNKIDKQIGEYAVSRSIAPLMDEYKNNEKVSRFLNELKNYIMENLDQFKGIEEPVNPVFGMPMSQIMGGRDLSVPFKVNVFIDNSGKTEPPVVIEPNPNFGNIFGKIERRFLFGGYVSDHTMLKAGAVSIANGGYLLVNVVDVLLNPGVWIALKRAIKNKEVRIEDPYEQFGIISVQGMKPEPMPVTTKIVLIGDGTIYQALSIYDEEFWEIFKVKADFDYEIKRTDENMQQYAAFLSGCCEECKARHFDRTGVAKILEYSARIVADQGKLSSRFAQVKEMIEEANYWAKKDNSEYISAKHIRQAIDEKIFRHNLVDDKIQEMITEGTIMIDTKGEAAGQINGLSVYSMGDISFGKPSRITARTYLGRSGVINIERETQMSGPIHNKGVMILSGYLGWKYAQDKPLSLAASLCFEQSYEGVEGDSASSAELYAILSSISEAAIKQNIAVTGSVNQKGEIQPIGGVNQKIEGFFKCCKAIGLTGEQGVLIPQQNLRNLMLREEVVDAVKDGKFHIWSARTIDEGIEILTGLASGEKQIDGTYPENTINFLVDKKLRKMADLLKAFANEGAKEEKKEPLQPVAVKHN